MDLREGFANIQDAIEQAVAGARASIWTALPCVVTRVHDDGQHADMQPAIKSTVLHPDGTTKNVDLPLLPKVPLHFPRGGGVSMTFPVKPGDEALVIFSARPADTWKQSGGVQQQIDGRMHDLSDGFGLVGFRSAPSALNGVSTSSTQLRSDDGQHVIDLHPGHGLTLTSGGVSLKVTGAGVDIDGGYLRNNGHDVGSTHKHTGVVPGGALSGVPQ